MDFVVEYPESDANEFAKAHLKFANFANPEKIQVNHHGRVNIDNTGTERIPVCQTCYTIKEMGLLPVASLQHPAHVDVDVEKEFAEWTDEKVLKKALIKGLTDDVDVSPFGADFSQPFDLKRFGKISKGQTFLIKAHEMPAARLDKYFK